VRVTDDRGLPHDLTQWPSHVPTAPERGQLELTLDGVFGTDQQIAIEVPDELADAATTAGVVVLSDEEGTPLAQLTVHDVTTSSTGARQLIGSPRRLREARTGPFRALRRTPEQLRHELDGGPAIAVGTGRPFTRSEATAIVAAADASGARVVVVAFALDTPRQRFPIDVLIRALRASLPDLDTSAGPAVLTTLPVEPSRDDTPPRGVLEFITAIGATAFDPSQLDSETSEVILTTLERDDPGRDDPERGGPDVAQLLPAGATTVLRAWRPPRPERGLTLFFTGLSGSGKSTVARGVVDVLLERGRTVTSVDGDVARRMLSAGLSFSRADRDLNILRIGWVAGEVTKHGGVAVCAPIAPYAATRARVRELVEAHGDFVLIHISTPLEVCEARDRKGLYAKARAGLIENFTGISDPYEEPVDADLTLDTSTMPVDEAVARVVDHLVAGGWLAPA
jgi:sulfate adenylyltransferase